MPEMDLGQKQACSDCGSLFFDLHKSPPVCPSCGEEMRLTQPRAPAPAPKPEIPPDVVEDPVDETKQDDDEFDDDPDSVALRPSPKPVIDEEALDDD